MFVVAAFYRFAELDDAESIRLVLLELLSSHDVKGTVILAHEGINGTVAGSVDAMRAFKNFLLADERLAMAEYKESHAEINPFKRLKVKIKPEIVTMGLSGIDIANQSGTYVTPEEWNQLICDPEVTVLDVRNDFEVRMGTFKNAINPKTDTFRDFPKFVENNLSPTTHKKIAMSCTGGIRCEKASAYMKQHGFLEVFHLKGGVLQYINDTPKDKSLWQGDCFVFDDRIAVDHALSPISVCACCGGAVHRAV
jgi:UPF0176 protein